MLVGRPPPHSITLPNHISLTFGKNAFFHVILMMSSSENALAAAGQELDWKSLAHNVFPFLGRKLHLLGCYFFVYVLHGYKEGQVNRV